jgi:hypothetical protein
MLVELRGISPITEAGMVFTTDEAIWCGIACLFEKATGMSLDGVFLLNEAVAGVPGLSSPDEAEEMRAALRDGLPDDRLAELLEECGTDLETLRGAARRFVAFSKASGGWVVRTPTRA